MIKILVCSEIPNNTCSRMRSMGPFSFLRKLTDEIDIQPFHVHSSSLQWNDFLLYDLIFMERPSHPNSLLVFRQAKELGIPVWVDWDDDMWSTTDYHSAQKFWLSPETTHIMRYCLENADFITCSTAPLVDAFKERLKITCPIEHIPNGFDDYTFELPEDPGPRKKIISWRGSDTHRGDLLSVLPELTEVMDAHPDWKFVLWGGSEKDKMWWLKQKVRNVVVLDLVDFLTFNKVFCMARPAIHIHPLADNLFNRCKSNLAWQEGTWAGAASVVVDMPDWYCGLKYTPCKYTDATGRVGSAPEFAFQMNKLMDSEDLRRELYTESRNYILENLTLSKLNVRRIEIIKTLAEGRGFAPRPEPKQELVFNAKDLVAKQ